MYGTKAELTTSSFPLRTADALAWRSRGRFFSGSDRSVLLWPAPAEGGSLGAPSSSGASATSLFSSSSSCARFFLGDDICSFKTSSLGGPRLTSGVSRLPGLLRRGSSSSEPLLSSWDMGWGCPALSEMLVCFSSRRAAVVSASSFAVPVSAWSEMSLVLCGSSAMMSAAGWAVRSEHESADFCYYLVFGSR